jgi:VWFA-related protein
MRVIVSAWLIGVFLGQAPTFRAGTTLVEFTVIARDNKDRPVIDLAKDDIVVTEDGTARDVAFFRFDGAVETRRNEALPPGLFSNRPEYSSGPPRNITAIVIDTIDTLPADQIFARAQMLRYLDTVTSNTRVGVYEMGWRTTVVHDFTDDLESLRARVAAVSARPQAQATEDQSAPSDKAPVSDQDSLASMKQLALDEMAKLEMDYQEKVAATKRLTALASLEAIGNHLAGMPGRKSLVWITAGIPIHTTFRFPTFHEAQIRDTAQRLATLGVSVYPVDARGLTTLPLRVDTTGRGSTRIPAPPQLPDGLPDQRLWATMDVMAEVTGGRVAKNTNDLTQGMKDAAADLRSAYTVGFYTSSDTDSVWHRLEVKAKRRGVKLSHRQGYRSERSAAEPTQWSAPQWRWAIESPLGSTVIHLDARLEPVANAAGTYGLLLLIAPEELHFQKTAGGLSADVEIVTAEMRANGSFEYYRTTTMLALPEGTSTAGSMVRYADRWTIKPGTSTVRLIVRDRFTGRYGTLDMPLTRVP